MQYVYGLIDQPCELETRAPTLQMGKLRLMGVKVFVQEHSAHKWQDRNLKLEILLRSLFALFKCFIPAPGTFSLFRQMLLYGNGAANYWVFGTGRGAL